MLRIILVEGFWLLKINIIQFPDWFHRTTSLYHFVREITSGTFDPGLSDHCLVYGIIKLQCTPEIHFSFFEHIFKFLVNKRGNCLHDFRISFSLSPFRGPVIFRSLLLSHDDNLLLNDQIFLNMIIYSLWATVLNFVGSKIPLRHWCRTFDCTNKGRLQLSDWRVSILYRAELS